MELTEEQKAIKALRVSIHTCIEEAKVIANLLARGDGAREVALCITQMQQGSHWAGAALGALGHLLPPEYRDEARR